MKYRSSHLIKRERLIGLFSGCIVTMVSPLRGLGKMADLINATFSNRRDILVRIMLFQQLKKKKRRQRLFCLLRPRLICVRLESLSVYLKTKKQRVYTSSSRLCLCIRGGRWGLKLNPGNIYDIVMVRDDVASEVSHKVWVGVEIQPNQISVSR